MDVRDYLKILQARWKIVVVVTVVVILGALGASLIATPVYQASTRLFVSTSTGTTVNEAYQGNQLSQQLVTSYAKLLTGRRSRSEQSMQWGQIDWVGCPRRRSRRR